MKADAPDLSTPGADLSTANDLLQPADLTPVNPCQGAVGTTVYVNATTGSSSNNGGAASCPLLTITAALAATADSAHDGATISVAAGSYGANETFPLIVNHGRSIVGAGASSTTIQGSSAIFTTAGTMSIFDTGTHYVSIVAGDTTGVSNLRGFTLLPASTITTPTVGYLGIVCLAGNAPNGGTTATPVPPLPAANLVIDSVTVGPNFDSGIITSSAPTQMTACNAIITRSLITGCNVGIGTGACGTANPVNAWASTQIGDGQSGHGNTFTGSAIDVFGQGCGSLQSINVNQFNSGLRGMVLVSAKAQYFEVLGNTFNGAAGPMPMGIGIQTNSGAVIAKLNQNVFVNISQTTAADTAAGVASGFALRLSGGLLQAHGNQINNNDNGIAIDGAPPATFDFSSGGTSTDGNQIYCNAKGTGGVGNGYDLVLNYSAGNVPTFAGNVWDNATPTTSVSVSTSANGTDAVTGTSNGATLTGGTATATACVQSRVK